MKYFVTSLLCLGLFMSPFVLIKAQAQEQAPSGIGAEVSTDEPVYISGVVTRIIDTKYSVGQTPQSEEQILEIESAEGELLSPVYNDYTRVAVGDKVYLTASYNPVLESTQWYVTEVDRMEALWLILGIFVVVYVAVAGFKGVRSLGALVIAVLAVWFVLLPLMQAGYDPLLVGSGISALILGIAIFLTHGLSIVSLVSYVGSMIAILLTILFALWSFSIGAISGEVGDQAMTLSLLYHASLDLPRLLLAGMIIGILGVLDDVAVMQAAMVREFFASRPTEGSWQIFKRAMQVGREHAAALVNTLVLAYTAVALPLLLVVFAPTLQGGSDIALSMHFSNELFAVEFIRSIVGSFGLVLTVPIVTALAVLLYQRFPPKGGESDNAHRAHAHHHHA